MITPGIGILRTVIMTAVNIIFAQNGKILWENEKNNTRYAEIYRDIRASSQA